MFLEEAGLPYESATVGKDDITIEKVLEEKKTFDLSVNFEKLGTHEGDQGWSSAAPAVPNVISSLPSTSNILHVSTAKVEDAQAR